MEITTTIRTVLTSTGHTVRVVLKAINDKKISVDIVEDGSEDAHLNVLASVILDAQELHRALEYAMAAEGVRLERPEGIEKGVGENATNCPPPFNSPELRRYC